MTTHWLFTSAVVLNARRHPLGRRPPRISRDHPTAGPKRRARNRRHNPKGLPGPRAAQPKATAPAAGTTAPNRRSSPRASENPAPLRRTYGGPASSAPMVRRSAWRSRT